MRHGPEPERTDSEDAVVTQPHDLRLVAPALAAWIVAFAVVGRGDAASAWAIGSAVVAVLALAALGVLIVRGAGRSLARDLLAVLALGSAAVALIAAGAATEAARSRPPVLVAAAVAGERVDVVGVVVGLVPHEAVLDGASARDDSAWGAGGDTRYRVRASALTIDGRTVPVESPLLVFGAIEVSDGVAPGIGTTVAVTGRLRAVDPADDVAALLFADDPARVVGEPGGLLAGSNALRASFVAAAATLPGSGGALLPGLVVGDTRAVPPSLDADMKTASLAHLTAVSGSNCAIVVAGVLFVGRALGLRRGVRLAAAGVALASFVLLVTPEGSVVRASVMAGVVLAAGSLGRRPSGVPLVSLAVIVLLAVSPPIARDAGFALSVAATVGLLVVAGPLADRLARVVPRPLAGAIAVPVAAQLTCQPVLILLEPSVPVHGVVANLLAAPAAPIATVVGLEACLLLPAVPVLGHGLTWIAWVPAQWIGSVATVVADWPAATWPWLPGALGAITFGVVVAGVVLLVLPSRVGRGSRVRRAAAVLVVAAVVVWTGITVGDAVRLSVGRPDDWRAVACDVGQGDATLVRAGDRVALIDTGPEPEPLEACLEAFDVDRVDLLVLTHFDRDHDGAAAALLGRVSTLVVPDTEEAGGERIVDRFAETGAEIRRVAAGDAFALDTTAWSVLWPPAVSRPSWREGNGASVVVRVDRPDGPSLLALGDLGAGEQRELLDRAGGLVRADVVKVSHHGSADQAPELYDAIGATVGLVSVGADNDYAHPTPEALAMLAAAGTTAVRTDERGTIAVSPSRDGGVAVSSRGPGVRTSARSITGRRFPPTPRSRRGPVFIRILLATPVPGYDARPARGYRPARIAAPGADAPPAGPLVASRRHERKEVDAA